MVISGELGEVSVKSKDPWYVEVAAKKSISRLTVRVRVTHLVVSDSL